MSSLEGKTERIYGLDFFASFSKKAVELIIARIKSEESFFALTVNLDYIGKRNLKLIKKSFKKADFILPDGMPIVWASKIANRPLTERITGCDLGRQLILKSKDRGLKVFLLATNSEGKRVGEGAGQKYRKKGIDILGATQDYDLTKQSKSDPKIINQIKKFKPDILLVGFGCPYQEQWILENQKDLEVPFCMGVGGSLDVWAGMEKRAPKWMQEFGMEWLFQIYKKPKKLFRYLNETPTFVKLIIWAIKVRFQK